MPEYITIKDYFHEKYKATPYEQKIINQIDEIKKKAEQRNEIIKRLEKAIYGKFVRKRIKYDR